VISNHPEITGPAMEVIRDHEPRTYAQMNDAPWRVYIVTDIRRDAIVGELASESWSFAANFPAADAVTVTSLGNPPTLVNLAQVQEDAGSNEVSFEDMLAETLVHEFRHYQGADEIPAFRAGIRFSRELGDEKLAEAGERVLARAEQGDYPS
jgi:hypothetical protein